MSGTIASNHHSVRQIEAELQGRENTLQIMTDSVKDSMVSVVRRFTDPYVCWTHLRNRYESRSGSRRLMLLRKIVTFRKEETVSMEKYLTDVKNTIDQLENLLVNIPEELIVLVLHSLPREYHFFKKTQTGKDLLPTFLELESKLLDEELQLSMDAEREEESETLYFKRGSSSSRGRSQHRGSGRNSGRQGRSDSHRSEQRGKSVSRNERKGRYDRRDSREDTCHHCGETGHMERDCQVKHTSNKIKELEEKLKNLQKKKKTGGQANSMEKRKGAKSDPDSDSDSSDAADVLENYLYEFEANSYELEVNTCEVVPDWILDSGATNHVTGNSSLLVDLKLYSSTASMTAAGGESHRIAGIGNVPMKLSNGEIKTMTNVLYVPGVRRNLLSVGCVTDDGYSVKFYRNKCLIKHRQTRIVVCKGSRLKRGLYKLNFEPVTPIIESHTIETKARQLSKVLLWHRRLGHLNFDALHQLSQHKIVKGLPKLARINHICEVCHEGKQARKKISPSTTESTEVLQLIHSDVCGPFRTSSYTGAKYFVSFIDDYSRKTWVYLIKTKDAVYDEFRKF
jgi:hypothetical protein